MIKVAVYLAFTISLAAQQNLPEPNLVESKSDFKDALKATLPVLVAPPKPPAPVTLPPKDAADALSEDELKGVIQTLRDAYVRPAELDDVALARARFQGMLERLGNGVRIFAGPTSSGGEKQPFHAELLPDETAYIRLGTLSSDAIAALDTTLAAYSKTPAALILDLRATPPNADFEQAAEVCRRFCPKGRILFSIKRTRANDEEVLTSRMNPTWHGTLVVLVDGDTAGSGEVIAAVLRTHVAAYVIGQQTRGEAAQFEEIPMAQGRVLKVAVGEVTLPDATPVFPGGLRPDLVVDVPQEKTDEVLFAALGEKELAPLITDQQRPRMNEAALVAGTNPELEALQITQRIKSSGQPPKAQVRDTVLQRAVDFVTAIRTTESTGKK